MKTLSAALVLVAGMALSMPAIAAPLPAVVEGEPAVSVPPPLSATVPSTRQIDFRSTLNGRDYRIQIALPLTKPPANGFPVIYVMDGDGYFGTWAFAARLRAMSQELEPAVVVGIGYPEAEQDLNLAMQRRVNELVPTIDPERLKEVAGSPLGAAALYAGADDLLQVIHTEVASKVASVVPINGARSTLFGHSLGGLFALDALFTHPEYFQTYLVLSPSIWWDGRAVLGGRAAFLKRVEKGEVAPRIYFAVGSLEQPDPAQPLRLKVPPGMTEAQLRQLMVSGAMVDNTLEMLKVLQLKNPPAGYEVKGRVVPEETHVSVAWAALNEMLDFAVPLRP
jgi:predicted alpha/beta superfamily hydrolase